MTNHNLQTEMKKVIFINLTLILSLTIGFISCNQETKSNNQTAVPNDKTDTIIVKHKNDLNKSYEVGLLSKSYSYYWLVGNDTLDFSVNAREYEKDSTLHLSIHHKKPIKTKTCVFDSGIKHLDFGISVVFVVVVGQW